jgi:hypothetical protein
MFSTKKRFRKYKRVRKVEKLLYNKNLNNPRILKGVIGVNIRKRYITSKSSVRKFLYYWIELL